MRESSDVALAIQMRPRRSGMWEVSLIGLLALAVRLVDLGFAPFIDEMHHVLAASSLLEDGTLAIHEGREYQRGSIFTYVVAGFFAIFGESLVVARLPSVFAGVLLICLLFAWLRAEAGRMAAWTAGLLLCFAPIAIYLSQWARFYSVHALAFWLGSFCVYRLVTRADPAAHRWWIGAVGAVALVLAYRLQVTTLAGLAGLIVFAAAMESPRFVRSVRRSRNGWLLAAGTALGIVGAIAAGFFLGIVEDLLARARMVDIWAVGTADNPRFYHWLLADQYGFLWALFPLAVLLAVARRWSLALLFTVVFGVAMAVHSVAAWKAERFIYYALPGFFAVWGLATGEFVPWLWRRLVTTGETFLQAPRPWIARTLVAAALVASAAFALTVLPAYTYARQILLRGDDWSPPANHLGERYRGHSDWAEAASRLAPLADSVQVVIGQSDMKTIYYLGDVDYVLYASYLVDISHIVGLRDLQPEFTPWPKVGRPLVSRPESVEAIMRCYASGLIVAEQHVWGWEGAVPRATADFIEENARTVELPENTRMLAFRWETAEPERSEHCDRIQRARQEARVQQAARGSP